jgi:IstB-like ATP binding protein
VLACDTPGDRERRHHESVGSERLTGALLDRLTHHVHILEMNGESYRLKHSKARRQRQLALDTGVAVDPDTGEIHDA